MSQLFRAVFVVSDFILLNLSIYISSVFFKNSVSYPEDTDFIYLLIFSNLSWLFLIMVGTPYKIDKSWSISKIIKSQLTFISIHLMVVGSLVFFFKREYHPLLLVSIYLLFISSFFLWRILIYYLRSISTPELVIKNFIVIGNNQIADSVIEYYNVNQELGYRFCGSFDSKDDELEISNIKQFCVTNEVHEILCCASDMDEDILQRMIGLALDSLIKIRVMTSPVGASSTISFEPSEKLQAVTYVTLPLDSPVNRFNKRLFDLIFSSLVVLSILSWLVPLIAILIKVDSRGPVFFLQPRSGRNKNIFKCIKFRTMRVNAESNLKQATRNDERLTKLGSFLRRTSIDELPQFFNVFVGDMAIVGPRPLMLKHTEDYSRLLEKFMGRHYVKPGITGLAQVMGYRGETKYLFEMKNRVTLDLFYIENWSFALDIRVVYLTVVSLLRGSEKAY